MARRALDGEDLARYESVTLYDITYASDGLRIKGYLALPPSHAGTRPAIIFNRGGTGPRGALSPEAAMQIIGLYASWGYVAIASNYRGVGGSEGTREEWGGNDVNDAMACLHVLDGLSYVDHAKIGLVGGSRGGMMALMMLARTDRFRAAVTFGAPTSIHRQDDEAYIRRTMMKYLPEGSDARSEAERRSAVTFAEQLCRTTPLLVLHGTGDRRVSAEQSLELAMELQRLQHPYKLIMYDNADHVLAGRRKESNDDIRWWMDHYVKNGSRLPRTGPHGA
jgi:dipeptidyl aminopeptidase/acylaminoacyl peptidase